MKLYTKRGDDGTTGLIGGKRVLKSELRVATCGEIDEVNAVIGLVRCACEDGEISKRLGQIQSELFILGAQIGTEPNRPPELTVQDSQVGQLEAWIDEASSLVPPLDRFILPGGSELAARLHLARAVCRRAERALVALAAGEPIADPAKAYLNRLSDLLFALARWANQRAGVADVPWEAPNH